MPGTRPCDGFGVEAPTPPVIQDRSAASSAPRKWRRDGDDGGARQGECSKQHASAAKQSGLRQALVGPDRQGEAVRWG